MYGMMSFDLNKEVLNCDIKFPVCTLDARIIEFNDTVAVIVLIKNESNDKINMWTLDDEACLRGGGVEASWTQMFSVDLDLSIQFVYSYFRNGDLLLMTDVDEWLLYNSFKKEARVVPASFNMLQIYKYTESSQDSNKWNADEDDNWQSRANCNANIHPLVIAAHPQEPNQFALGLSDGGVHVFEPLESEGKWGVPPPAENGSATSSTNTPSVGTSGPDQPQR